jgi:hypothetical protein
MRPLVADALTAKPLPRAETSRLIPDGCNSCRVAAAEVAQADRYLMRGTLTGRDQVISVEGDPAGECNDNEGAVTNLPPRHEPGQR